MYSENTAHYSLWSSDFKSQWESQFPASNGFLDIDGRKYDVTMFHQLRCLGHIQDALISNAPQKNSQSTVDFCFYYLMQLELCQSDATLEPAYGMHLDLDQYQPHVCRDWTALYNV